MRSGIGYRVLIMCESVPSKKDVRKEQILRATLRLLRTHGAGITTAQIAAEAHCSKETLYNWFGDRDGILRALVAEQAKGMNAAMLSGMAKVSGTVEEKLKQSAALLLDILTGEAVLSVNRVAMAQACNNVSNLGDQVLADWDENVAAPFLKLFAEARSTHALSLDDDREGFEKLMGLLVGDRQRRLLLGEDARPNPANMQRLADEAVDQWLTLYRR